MKRAKPPTAMATQHPDSASRSFTSQEEIDEALRDLSPADKGGFECDEKMVDFEGKLTAYGQMRWIIEKVTSALNLEPDVDFLVTPRIPSEKLEEAERQMMVIWAAVAANKYSYAATGRQGIRYLIAPMAESSRELLVSHRRINKLLKLGQEELGLPSGCAMSLIPLFEDVVKLLHCHEIVDGYRRLLLKELGEYQDHFRVFLGKSDAAMTYGHLASALALKIALSRLEKWRVEEHVEVCPIIGVGLLPFRGHLAPWSVDDFVKEYRGYYTVTIQSGLRYDLPHATAIRVIRRVKEEAGHGPQVFTEEEERDLVDAIREFTRCYFEVMVEMSTTICLVADVIPERRDRIPRESYYRSLMGPLKLIGDRSIMELLPRGEVKLPRAIKFVAACYLLGVPPAIIGSGRALKALKRIKGEGFVEDLAKRYYSCLKRDFKFEFNFLNLEVACRRLSRGAFERIAEDVEELSRILNLDPKDKDEKGVQHDAMIEMFWQKIGKIEAVDYALKAGIIRGSLG
ncbi:MAG: phosphoenolpyruvate carboxylase [Thermoprotei archaeon]|nr:MAG: phosphoenolpyruvate carboxylase [Thermoprotei archaeon]RLF21224.1 MAG: phosphoenolpyruvate carboxylase [Thermoprotei archaeon]